MKDRLIVTLVGGLGALAFLWIMTAPSTVTRAEMHQYVEATATEHLRLLRADIKFMSSTLSRVGERLAAVEAVLRERPNG